MQFRFLSQNVATSYLEQWQDIALSSDGSHYTLSYGDNPSQVSWRGRVDPHDSNVPIRWGLLYNLYADRLLGFNMFPQSVYETREFDFSVLCSPMSTRPNRITDRDEMVFNQNQRIRNSSGQQVENHCKSPTIYLRANPSPRQVPRCKDWSVFTPNSTPRFTHRYFLPQTGNSGQQQP